MPYPKKCSDLDLVASYARLDSVWAVAREFGMCGQSVHERLKKLGVDLSVRVPQENIEKIRSVYSSGFLCGDGTMQNLCAETGLNKQQISRFAKSFGLSDLRRSVSNETLAKMSKTKIDWHEKNAHPRGMLGKKHSIETKKELSKITSDRAKSFGKTKRVQIAQNAMKTRWEKYGTLALMRSKTTWKQGWREIGGIKKYYRSRWEANYARYLEFLKLRNEISDWKHEPQIFWFDGIKRGTNNYTPDFRVVKNDGSVEYHEVKGWMDPKSLTKIKRMKKYYPGVILIVIDGKFMKSLAQVSALIPDWEK